MRLVDRAEAKEMIKRCVLQAARTWRAVSMGDMRDGAIIMAVSILAELEPWKSWDLHQEQVDAWIKEAARLPPINLSTFTEEHDAAADRPAEPAAVQIPPRDPRDSLLV